MAYAPIVLPADLASVKYQEIIDEITRDEEALVTEAIATAIQEAKMYLSRYDLAALFGNEAEDTAATHTDTFLTRLVKNIAIWHLLQLSNQNIDYDSAKTLYDQAIASLKNIQKGMADPKWPYQDHTGEAEATPASDQVTIQAKTPRENYY